MNGSRGIFSMSINDGMPRALMFSALFLLSFLDLPSVSLANTTFAGNIRLVEGITQTQYVKIIRPGFTKILVGKPGDALFEGDTIKTDDGVRAQLELSDQTIISLAPNSNVQMKGYMVDQPSSRRNTVLRMLKGTARFIVAKLFKTNANGNKAWSHSSVTIETMNAVAGVRGTDFFVSREDAEEEIAVLDGAVGVRSIRSGSNGEIILGRNQISHIAAGGRMGPVETLSSERRDVLMNRTALVKPISQTNGDVKGKKAKTVKKFNKDDVERDLAAGMPLSTVMDKAVESGMTIEEFVTAAMDAGVHPVAVIYTGIQEGYTPNAIVESAIESGASINDVFSAAISAGAEQQSVIAGSQEAGVPPADIAGALTSATTIDSSNLNTTVPQPGTPSTTISPVLLPIGGGTTGGGGTPSASPYIP